MSSIVSPLVPTARGSRPFSPSRFATLAAAAAGLNLITYGIGAAVGASMVVAAPDVQEIPLVLAALATVVPMAVAGVLTWFIARRRPGFRRIAAWTGLVIGVLTAASPMASSADTPTGVALGFMHVIVGIAWFVALRAPRATEQVNK